MRPLAKSQTVRIIFESDLPLSLDDEQVIVNLASKADRDFTHSSAAIRGLLGAL